MLGKKLLVTLLISIAVATVGISPATAQLPFVQDLAIYSRLLRQVQEKSLNSACIRLDGRCLFKLSATDSELLEDRINEIQQRFGSSIADYLSNKNSATEVSVRPNGNLQDLYLTIGDRTERLFTVTSTDARANDVDVPVRARQLESNIEQGLAIARQERSPQFLRRQIIFGTMYLLLDLAR